MAGGKPRYSISQVCEAIADTRGLISITAKRLGCSGQTVRDYVARYPLVAQALKDEREKLLDIGEMALVKAVQAGEGWAVCFLLKTLGKDRGFVERQERTGPNGGPVETSSKVIILPCNERHD